MIDTPISSAPKISMTTVERIVFLIFSILNVDSKSNNKWPATILAISRTDRVKGRMIILTVSINTINLIKAIGVPAGVRWAKKFFQFTIREVIIRAIHTLKANGKLKDKCEVLEIIYGNREKKFNRKTKVKT